MAVAPNGFDPRCVERYRKRTCELRGCDSGVHYLSAGPYRVGRDFTGDRTRGISRLPYRGAPLEAEGNNRRLRRTHLAQGLGALGDLPQFVHSLISATWSIISSRAVNPGGAFLSSFPIKKCSTRFRRSPIRICVIALGTSNAMFIR